MACISLAGSSGSWPYSSRSGAWPTPRARTACGLFATYWHFLGALWLYLVVLLFVL